MEKNEEAGNGNFKRPEPVMEWQLPHHHQRRRRDDDYDDVPLLASANCLRITAFLAIFTGIGALGASSWVLHRSIQAWKNPTLVTANELLSQVNTFFGGTTGLYDLDVIYRIITACSATCFVGGIVQFLMSMWLLLASETGGRGVARAWVIVHVFVLLAIGGSFLCIMTNELQINNSLIVFLSVSGVDFVLLLLYMYIVFMYSSWEDY